MQQQKSVQNRSLVVKRSTKRGILGSNPGLDSFFSLLFLFLFLSFHFLLFFNPFFPLFFLLPYHLYPFFFPPIFPLFMLTLFTVTMQTYYTKKKQDSKRVSDL